MAECNKDCLNCVLPQCKFDKVKKKPIPKEDRPKKKYKKNDPEYFNQWYWDNREHVLARAHERYLEKREEILEYQKRYREAHKEEWRKGGKYDYSHKQQRKPDAARSISKVT